MLHLPPCIICVMSHGLLTVNVSSGRDGVLRMSTKASAEVLPGMYNTQHSLGADSLHCLGQASLQVSSSLTHCLRIISSDNWLYTRYSRLSNWLSNGFDNRLNVCIHDTTGCQTGLSTGLTTGCIVYINIYPVVKLV